MHLYQPCQDLTQVTMIYNYCFPELEGFHGQKSGLPGCLVQSLGPVGEGGPGSGALALDAERIEKEPHQETKGQDDDKIEEREDDPGLEIADDRSEAQPGFPGAFPP